jgi:RimJ/RimL family protein N-acetyltransferase
VSRVNLTVRDIEESDLPNVFELFIADPAYLQWTEGSEGEPGRYDLGKLERDWMVARMMGRRMLGLFADAAPIGVADVLENNPEDDVAWIGLIMVHPDARRQGVGRQIAEGIFDELRALGRERVRAGTFERNVSGIAFASAVGFHQIETRENGVVVMERML